MDWTHAEKQQGQVRALSINSYCGRSQSTGQFRDEALEMVLLGQRAFVTFPAPYSHQGENKKGPLCKSSNSSGIIQVSGE